LAVAGAVSVIRSFDGAAKADGETASNATATAAATEVVERTTFTPSMLGTPGLHQR